MRSFRARIYSPIAAAVALSALFASAVPACTDDEVTPIEVDFTPAADESAPVAATFSVTVDPSHPALQTTYRQPQEGPVTITGESPDFTLVGHAKTISIRPGVLWVDLYIVNKRAEGLRGMEATLRQLAGAASFLNLSEDPLSEDAVGDSSVRVGGVAAEGVGHITLGFPVADGPVSFELALSGATTKRAVTSSSPVHMTPDGAEAWIAMADADLVAVVDTTKDERIAQIPVPGKPRSVAVTGDGALVLVASSENNTVSVIDRASRSVIQTLDESAGIGREPRSIIASSDGARAYVSSYVGDTVTALQRLKDGRFRVAGALPVGRRPAGMSLTADGATLLVSHFLPRGPLTDNEAWVSVVRTNPLALAGDAVFRDDTNLKDAECLADLFAITPEEIVFEGVATELAGVFLTPGGDEGWMPALRFGPQPVWEVPEGTNIPGVVPSRFAPSFVLFLNTRSPESAVRMEHPGMVDPPDANLAFLKCGGLGFEVEMATRQLIESSPNEQLNSGAATPSGMSALSESGVSRFIGFSRGGRRALILSYAADELTMYDAVTHHPVAQRNLMLTGSNPIGLSVTPDGQKAYVVYESSLFASVLDLGAIASPSSLPPASYVPYEFRKIEGETSNSILTRTPLVRRIDGIPELPPTTEVKQITLVDADPMDPLMRRGRILFNSSHPDKYPGLSVSRQATCAACHPDGGHDGAGWGTMEGERRTMSLRGGVGGRGWLHQSATHKNADEFVRTVVAERLGGKDTSEEDIKALATYLAWGIPKLQSPKVDGALAAQGKAIFESKCTGCHSGDQRTSGNPDKADPYGGGMDTGPILYDVGTAAEDMKLLLPLLFTKLFPPPTNQLYKSLRGDRPLGEGDSVQETLGFRQRPNRTLGQVKAPSLTNVWDNAVFFHDGRFSSMAEAIDYLNDTLKLGLSDGDKHAVIEYLKTL